MNDMSLAKPMHSNANENNAVQKFSFHLFFNFEILYKMYVEGVKG